MTQIHRKTWFLKNGDVRICSFSESADISKQIFKLAKGYDCDQRR